MRNAADEKPEKDEGQAGESGAGHLAVLHGQQSRWFDCPTLSGPPVVGTAAREMPSISPDAGDVCQLSAWGSA